MTIAEKVAYLKGMFAGMELDTEKSKEAKLLGAVIDVLEDIGASLTETDERFEAVGEEIDALSDDLSDLEEIVYDEDDDDDEDEDEDDFFEIECPNCGEPLSIDEDVLEEGVIVCPSCEQKFVLDLSDDCECGCGCEHDHGEDDGEE